MIAAGAIRPSGTDEGHAIPPSSPGGAGQGPPAQVPDWAGYLRFRDRFQEAIDPARHTIEWLDRQILDGTFGLIVGERAAIVFSIECYVTGARDIHGQIAAGDLREIAEVLIPLAEERARATGCIGAMISSRPGWSRRLGGQGYVTHQVTLRKEL